MSIHEKPFSNNIKFLFHSVLINYKNIVWENPTRSKLKKKKQSIRIIEKASIDVKKSIFNIKALNTIELKIYKF